MIRQADGRLAVESSLTQESASALLQAGTRALKNGESVFDMAAVKDVDSAGLAVVLAWQRRALAGGKSIRIANAPPGLKSLADLYGVAELLPSMD